MRGNKHECPHCHVVLHATTGVDPNSERHKPRTGDLVVCFDCGGVSFATADGGRRLPTEEEAQHVDQDHRVIAVRQAKKVWDILNQQQRRAQKARDN